MSVEKLRCTSGYDGKPCFRFIAQDECQHTGALPVPKPEPFQITPSDRAALSAIRAWIVTAGSLKANAIKLKKAEQCFLAFKLWQQENQTKVPD